QNEILIGNCRALFQSNLSGGLRRAFDSNVMRLRSDIVDDESGIELYVERNIVAAAEAKRRHLWSYPRSIWNLIGVRTKAVSSFRSLLFARDVTRSDNHRKNKFVLAIFIFQCFDVADCDLDLFTGQNVGNRLGENVRSFLIEQTCYLSI